ncbi:MAG: hypothetical protein ACP5R4_12665 [Armatimonadota bacterium]
MVQLNENHKRVVRNVLLELDQALTTIEALMRDILPKGVLYTTFNPLSGEVRKRVLGQVEILRREIDSAAGKLGLRAEKQNAATLCASLLSVLWSDLEDIRSSKLSAYGALGGGQEELDAVVERLIKLVLETLSLVSCVVDASAV